MEEKFQFKAELLKVHKKNRRNKALTPSADEFEIKHGLFIVVPENAGIVTMTAARDFEDYLFTSMNVSSMVTTQSAEKAITLSLNEDIEDASGFMGYRITTKDSGITVEGYDEKGLAQGLYYLEDLMNIRKAPFLKKGVISGTFALYTGDGYLAAASSSSNYIATEDNLDADGSWTIDIDSSNDAVVEAQGTHTRNILQYNTSAPRFTCYKGTQKSVKIYAKSKKETTSIENPECENLAGGIYNSQGLLLPENINLKDLSPGVYIINKKKILVK